MGNLIVDNPLPTSKDNKKCCYILSNLAAELTRYSQLCKSVLDLDDQIRFAGVVNGRGRLIAGGMREGVKSLEQEKDDEVLFMELALRVRMRREFDEQLGPVKFTISSRSRVLAISFCLGDDILYVVGESEINYYDLPKKILKMIKQILV